MRPEFAIRFILAVCLLGVVLLGLTIRSCATRRAASATATPSPTATPATTPTATPDPHAVPASARGYRLAGTVAGDVRYAIVEDPAGGDELYRPGQQVPNVGRLLDVQTDRATFAGRDGTFELRVAAAPPPTASAAPRTDLATPRARLTAARRSPRPAPSGSASSP